MQNCFVLDVLSKEWPKCEIRKFLAIKRKNAVTTDLAAKLIDESKDGMRMLQFYNEATTKACAYRIDISTF